MLIRPSASFPFRQVTSERTMLTAITTKPIERGTTVLSWIPKGEIPTRSSSPSRSHMMQASIERRPSSVQ